MKLAAPAVATLAALAAMAPTAGAARAQEDPADLMGMEPIAAERPEEEEGAEEGAEPPWSGSLGVSFLATSGNSDTEALGIDFKAGRRPEPWGLDLAASLHRAENDGLRTAERYHGGLRVRRALAPPAERWALFGGASAERDRFADLDLRAILEAGVIYTALPGPRHTLELDLGAAWTDEDRTPPEPDRSSFGAIAGLGYAWQIGDAAAFTLRLTYHPNFDRSTDWRADLATALSAAITRRLSLKLGYEHHFRNQPIGDNEDADTVTRASLVWHL